MSCQELLHQHLHDRGLRITPQRELVLTVMHQISEPSTTEEIYERVHAINRSVDISTVYRTLELFQEFQLICAFDPGDGKRRYEHLGVKAPHHHLVCQSCGKVIRVTLEKLEFLVTYLAETHDFAVDPAGLTLPGQCASCQHQTSEGQKQTSNV